MNLKLSHESFIDREYNLFTWKGNLIEQFLFTLRNSFIERNELLFLVPCDRIEKTLINIPVSKEFNQLTLEIKSLQYVLSQCTEWRRNRRKENALPHQLPSLESIFITNKTHDIFAPLLGIFQVLLNKRRPIEYYSQVHTTSLAGHWVYCLVRNKVIDSLILF